MSHINLEAYYQIMFSLVQHHKYSITEIENLIPWEREIFVGLLVKYLKEENEAMENESRRNKYS